MSTKKVMILWSGGVESTSLLKWMLSETDDEIFTHYIKLDNPERSRALYELTAQDKLFKKLSAIRPFNHSMSSISICNGKANPSEYLIQHAIGIPAMYYHGCSVMHHARSLEDAYHKDFVDGKLILRKPKGHLWSRYDERFPRLQVLLQPGHKAEEVMPILKHYEHPKAWHMEYLGDLAEHTWSCRTPDGGFSCGKCHACLIRNGEFTIDD